MIEENDEKKYLNKFQDVDREVILNELWRVACLAREATQAARRCTEAIESLQKGYTRLEAYDLMNRDVAARLTKEEKMRGADPENPTVAGADQ